MENGLVLLTCISNRDIERKGYRGKSDHLTLLIYFLSDFSVHLFIDGVLVMGSASFDVSKVKVTCDLGVWEDVWRGRGILCPPSQAMTSVPIGYVEVIRPRDILTQQI